MASVFKRGKRRRNRYYYFSWHDHAGKRHTRCSRTTDKAAAERIAAKLEADAALRRERVIDPALEAISQQSQRAIDEHLADYEAKMRAADRSADHVARTARFIRAIAEAAGFVTIAGITADAVNTFATELREKRSARTVEAHLTAIKGFTRWLTENDKLPRDPLASVKKPNPKSDRRRERRMLLPDEWQWVRSVTLAEGVERFGMTAAERALLYTTAIQTGLRSGELRSLTRGRLFLEGEQPYVTCRAGSTKNAKDARQYIQPELAEQLRAHVATKAPRAPVFALPHQTNVADMLRADLADARRAWLKATWQNPEEHARRQESDFLAPGNHEGETLDFHSLRHTCGAWLAIAGVHPKVVQVVMRHSSIVLTMDTYGHLFPGQEADAVARLGDMLATPPKAMQATGTDDLAAGSREGAQRLAQRAGRGILQAVAAACNEEPEPDDQAERPKPLRVAGFGNRVRLNAACCESRPGGSRTPDPGIMSPLL